MRYWDASAVVALLVDEAGTALAQKWLAEDGDVVTWALTRLEVSSALERRAREARLGAARRRSLLQRCRELHDAMSEVVELEAVRTRAIAALGRHELRAADAAQLGAALLICDGDAASLSFVCLDRRLAGAAAREGFDVLTWPAEGEEP